jgi:hypothetical protein
MIGDLVLTVLGRCWKPLALIACAVGAFCLWSAHEREVGRMQRDRDIARHELVAVTRTQDSLLRVIDSVSQRVRKDSAYLTKWRTRYDRLHDTLNVHDTVQVQSFVVAADSTIRACTVTVADLTSLCERRAQLLVAKDTEIAVLKRLRPEPPSAVRTWAGRIGWALVGAGVLHAVSR